MCTQSKNRCPAATWLRGKPKKGCPREECRCRPKPGHSMSWPAHLQTPRVQCLTGSFRGNGSRGHNAALLSPASQRLQNRWPRKRAERWGDSSPDAGRTGAPKREVQHGLFSRHCACIRRIDRRHHRRRGAGCRQISRADGAHCRAVLGRQHDRPARPRDRRQTPAALEQGRDRGEPAGTCRHLQRGQGSCRRLHADAHLQRAHRHQPSQQEPGVRSDQGLRRGDPGRHHAPHHGGAPRLAGQERQGPDRAGAGEAGRAQLQLRRPRQHHGHRRRAVQAGDPDRHRARSLQRPAGDAYGHHPWRCGGGLFVLRRRGRSHPERKGAGTGGHWRHPSERPSRCSDLQGSRAARVPVQFLVRHPGASRHAAGDRRQSQRRYRPGRSDARRQSAVRAARRDARQHAARPVQRDHQGDTERYSTLFKGAN